MSKFVDNRWSTVGSAWCCLLLASAVTGDEPRRRPLRQVVRENMAREVVGQLVGNRLEAGDGKSEEEATIPQAPAPGSSERGEVRSQVAEPRPPLSVKINGPERSVIGKLVRLSLQETPTSPRTGRCPVDAREWSIEPPVEDWILSADGAQAYFTTPLAGEYRVAASVAGLIDGRLQSAHATWLVKVHPQEALTATVLAQSPQAVRAAPKTPEQWIREAALAVQSSAWTSEVRAIAARYRAAGTIAEANQLAAKVVSPAWSAPGGFFARVAQLFNELEREGMLPTPQHKQAALAKAAAVLEAL